MTPLTIRVFVDVIALLSGASHASTVFFYDDAPVLSPGRGTLALRSAVCPGQFVRWTATALDVQTPVWIRRLSFDGQPETPEIVAPPWARRFQGFVPAGLEPGSVHPYRLTLGFSGTGKRRVIVEGASLAYLPSPSAPVQPRSSGKSLSATFGDVL